MSDTIKHHKVVVALPDPLEANSVYYVRVGSGFDLYTTNDIGHITAYKLNNSSSCVVDTEPTLTYAQGKVSRIDYSNGNYKIFTYNMDTLTHIDYTVGTITTRKSFSYNPDGSLATVSETVL